LRRSAVAPAASAPTASAPTAETTRITVHAPASPRSPAHCRPSDATGPACPATCRYQTIYSPFSPFGGSSVLRKPTNRARRGRHRRSRRTGNQPMGAPARPERQDRA
jgi:hypothetical protein